MVTVDIGQFPHCDERVLHAPGRCEYCDARPEWQTLRDAWGIGFTDEELRSGIVRCPSTNRRTPEQVNAWGGNVAKPAPPMLIDAELLSPEPPHKWGWRS